MKGYLRQSLIKECYEHQEHIALPSRVVAVEEHVIMPKLTERLPEAAMVKRGFFSRDKPFGETTTMDEMRDTQDRLKKLDSAGVTVQVLS